MKNCAKQCSRGSATARAVWNGSLCLGQALSLAFSIPADHPLRRKAEFRGELPKEDFSSSQSGRAQRTAVVLFGAGQWLSVADRCGGRCLPDYLSSLALSCKVLQTLVSGPFFVF